MALLAFAQFFDTFMKKVGHPWFKGLQYFHESIYLKYLPKHLININVNNGTSLMIWKILRNQGYNHFEIKHFLNKISTIFWLMLIILQLSFTNFWGSFVIFCRLWTIFYNANYLWSCLQYGTERQIESAKFPKSKVPNFTLPHNISKNFGF